MKTVEIQKMLDEKIAKRSTPVVADAAPQVTSDFEELHKSESKNSAVVEFQNIADDAYLVAKMLNKPVKATRLYKKLNRFATDEMSELKKMTTSGSGTGAEWIPTGFSNQLIEAVQLAGKVANQFRQINMPTNPFNIPVQSSFATAYKGAEGSATTSSAVGTAQVALSATKVMCEVPLTDELNEDAAIAMLPFIKTSVAESVARGIEDCIINGDTTTTHMDNDITASADVRKCWKGLRKHALEQSYKTDLGSAHNYDALCKFMGYMGVYGADPSKLFWLCGVQEWAKLMFLRDASNNNVVITMDKFGSNASVAKGQLGLLAGIPVIASEFCRENLNASGVHDATTQTKGTITLVNKESFILGNRKDIQVEMWRDGRAQVDYLIASARRDFKPTRAIASNHGVHIGYNIGF
jgi:HK97 family phage major capsid protein